MLDQLFEEVRVVSFLECALVEARGTAAKKFSVDFVTSGMTD